MLHIKAFVEEEPVFCELAADVTFDWLFDSELLCLGLPPRNILADLFILV
jgi:hypothetical protein